MTMRLASVAAVALLTACGTTVPLSARQAAGPGLSPAAGPEAAPGDVAGPDGVTAGPVTSQGGSEGVHRPGGHGPAGPVAPDDATRIRTGVGVTASSVTLGVNYIDAAAGNAHLSSLGAEGGEQGDVRAQVKALESYINGHGGLAAGRKVAFVLHPVDFSQSLAANAQAACTDFTQDHQVFAAFSAVEENYPNDTFASCLARSGAITLSGALVPGSSKAFFDRYPQHYYAPGQLEATRAAMTQVQGLQEAQYFANGARIGLLYWDAPSFRDAYRDGLVPQLRRHGLTVTDARPISTAQSASDVGPVVSSIQAAVLRFRADRIDHVLFLDSGGALAQYFMTGAQNQGYAPRYGLTSDSNLPLLEANVPAAQLKGALAVGWQPTLDVALPQQPRTDAARTCDRIMSSAGIRPASQLDHWVTYRLCSGVFFLQRALQSASDWSPRGFRAAVERLGTTTTSAALGFAERYAPGKHWGADAYRALAFRDTCRCFTYTSGDRPVPS